MKGTRKRKISNTLAMPHPSPTLYQTSFNSTAGRYRIWIFAPIAIFKCTNNAKIIVKTLGRIDFFFFLSVDRMQCSHGFYFQRPTTVLHKNWFQLLFFMTSAFPTFSQFVSPTFSQTRFEKKFINSKLWEYAKTQRAVVSTTSSNR